MICLRKKVSSLNINMPSCWMFVSIVNLPFPIRQHFLLYNFKGAKVRNFLEILIIDTWAK